MKNSEQLPKVIKEKIRKEYLLALGGKREAKLEAVHRGQPCGDKVKQSFWLQKSFFNMNKSGTSTYNKNELQLVREYQTILEARINHMTKKSKQNEV